MISMDLITLNCTLESGENGKLYATITQIFFKNLMTIYHRWNNNRIWRQSTYRDIKEHCPGQASGSWKCAEKQDERSQWPLWCPRTPTLPKDLNTVHPSYFFGNATRWFAHDSVLPHERLLLSALYCGKVWGRMAGMGGTSPASGWRGKAQALPLQKRNEALCLGHLPPLSNPQVSGHIPAASCSLQHSLGIPSVYSSWPSLLWTSLFPQNKQSSAWLPVSGKSLITNFF